MGIQLVDPRGQSLHSVVRQLAENNRKIERALRELEGGSPGAHTHPISDITGLQAALDGKASVSHTHDDRYYTESELDDLLSEAVRLPTGADLTLLDDFNRANGGLGGNWTTIEGSGPQIDTNQIKTAAADDWSAAVWATALGAPHSVRIDVVVAPPADDDYHYLYLLDDDVSPVGAVNGYAAEFDEDYWDLWRIDNGTWTRLDAWSQTHDTSYVEDGDAIELSLRGRDVVFFRRRGGIWSELGRITDDAHRPTLMFRGLQFGPGTTVRFDNFRA